MTSTCADRDLLPGEPARAVTGRSKDGLAACGLHLVGDPVPGVERWVRPLQDQHPRPVVPSYPPPHGLDPGPQTRHEHLRALAGAGGCPHGADAGDHVVEPGGVEGHHVGVAPDHVERLLHRARWHRADSAQILGQDQVGIDGPDPAVVEGIDRFSSGDAGTDLGVDLLRTQRAVSGQSGSRDDRHGAGGRGMIAFEADAPEMLPEIQGEDDLGGGREEGDDLHSVGPRPATGCCTKSTCGSKTARREARRSAAKTGLPITRIKTAHVTARVRSKPKEVVRSKRR